MKNTRAKVNKMKFTLETGKRNTRELMHFTSFIYLLFNNHEIKNAKAGKIARTVKRYQP